MSQTYLELSIERDQLKSQLEAIKLRWQTGKPPKDGWYWIKNIDPITPLTIVHYVYGNTGWMIPGLEWAGPIPEPSEEA